MSGMDCVVRFSAAMAVVPTARMTSGDSFANSSAKVCVRSISPAAQRISRWRLRPSVQPRSPNASRNCAMRACERESFPWAISAPTTRIRSAGCADSTDGQAATLPPISAMRSRRLIRSPRRRSSASSSVRRGRAPSQS
jgi:hypothetical protein